MAKNSENFPSHSSRCQDFELYLKELSEITELNFLSVAWISKLDYHVVGHQSKHTVLNSQLV